MVSVCIHCIHCQTDCDRLDKSVVARVYQTLQTLGITSTASSSVSSHQYRNPLSPGRLGAMRVAARPFLSVPSQPRPKQAPTGWLKGVSARAVLVTAESYFVTNSDRCLMTPSRAPVHLHHLEREVTLLLCHCYDTKCERFNWLRKNSGLSWLN